MSYKALGGYSFQCLSKSIRDDSKNTTVDLTLQYMFRIRLNQSSVAETDHQVLIEHANIRVVIYLMSMLY